MKKQAYQAPSIDIVNLSNTDALLLSASQNGTQVIENGGSAQDNGITTADVKGSYSVWDDDWSK